MSDKLKVTGLEINSIGIYRNLLEDKLVIKLKAVIDELTPSQINLDKFINCYCDFFFEFAKSNCTSLEDYILEKVLFDENPFTAKGSYMEGAASDLDKLQKLSAISSKEIKNMFKDEAIVEGLPEWKNKSEVFENGTLSEIKYIITSKEKWSQAVGQLISFHHLNGSGIFAHYRAFVWEQFKGEGRLCGIEEPDPVRLSQLIGYEIERSTVVENTLKFIKGFPANNALLYGDRGTGKSSTVKAILNEYYKEGLRMIEVPKACLTDFPSIIRDLKGRKQKFIIFIDDLVFADEEGSYTALKAVLEGGLESKTSNIVIYATSNRRHLIKEYFSDRKGLLSSNKEEEVRAHDTVEEKLSLSDRFGISVVFTSPDQDRYLQIVEGIVSERNIKIDPEKLRSEALKWALWYNGRSARTAKQFVDWIEGEAK